MGKLVPLLWEEKLLANNNRSETSQRSEISLDTGNRLKQSIFKSSFHSETLSSEQNPKQQDILRASDNKLQAYD